MRFLIAVLSTHERTGWIQPCLAEFLANVGFTSGHQVATARVHNHVPAAAGRNFVGQKVAELGEDGPDWLVMIDNDMIPPMELLDCVKDAPEDAAIVVPQMHMWDETKPNVILCWGMDESKAKVRPDGKQEACLDDQKFHELTKCGTGAIFIRPAVFRKIQMPYFWYPYNALQGIEGTEDITFCQKVREAGFKIYGNKDVVVGHMHNMNLAVVAELIVKERKRAFDQGIQAASQPAAVACPA